MAIGDRMAATREAVVHPPRPALAQVAIIELVNGSRRERAGRCGHWSGLGVDHDLDRLLVASAGGQRLLRLVEPVGTGDETV